jgi:peptidoglycan/LPS O-acetylase OafA/YrhL
MFAYLAFPLLPLVIDWRRVPTPGLIAAIAVALGLLAYVMRSNGMATLGQAIPWFGVLRCVTEFAAGTAVAALWLRHREQPRRALVAALCVSSLGFASFATGLVNEIVAIPAALAALLLAIALTSNRPGNPLASWPLHQLGEISFSTYLSHSLLWTAFKMAFVASAVAVPPLLIGALLIAILLASLVLYHGVERPAQAWINRFGQTPKRGQQTR